LGAAWALWKKFHFLAGLAEGAIFFDFDTSSVPVRDLVDAMDCFPDNALSRPFIDLLSVVFTGEGILVRAAPSTYCDLRELRRTAREGRKERLVSSSLTEGLRVVIGGLFIGDPVRTGSDIAEGSKVGLPASMPFLVVEAGF
jgi:hypothetical protein